MVHPSRMAQEILFYPSQPDTIFVSAGNLGSANEGIFRSYDGGNNWTQLSGGLPTGFTGKTLLDCSKPPHNFELFASVADSLAGIGLYKSTDLGNTWQLINNFDFQQYQGWYSHDIAVNPTNPDKLFAVGIDAFRSTDGGGNLSQVSDWRNWFLYSSPPVGGPGGASDWVHADIHRAYWHPSDSNLAFFVTDGGVFRTRDGGQTFRDLSGGMQTTQFYPNFSSSRQDSNFALGGLQDNATVIYQGSKSWFWVIGGDGCSTAIDPTNDNRILASYQNGNILSSYDRGFYWNAFRGASGYLPVNFVAPFAMAETDPQTVLAAESKLFKTTNEGSSWTTLNSGNSFTGTAILALEISPSNKNEVWLSTTPLAGSRARLFHSSNGGNSFSEVTGNLPDRYYVDIEVDPADDQTAYVVLQGFGTDHVYQTTDGGGSWASVSATLPDVPTNSITIDPLFSEHLFVGNDLGVYASTDGGQSWAPFGNGLPDAVLAIDVSISVPDRKLRVATHGNGAWQVDLPDIPSGLHPENKNLGMRAFPNPAKEKTNLKLTADRAGTAEIQIFNAQGQVLKSERVEVRAGENQIQLDLSKFSAGLLYLQVQVGEKSGTLKILKK